MENVGLSKGKLALFANKRVLITGHTGFKGAWLAYWLKEIGADVLGYALHPQEHQKLFGLLDLEKSITHHVGDVRDFSSLQRLFDSFQPEFCFHLAAQPLVRASYQDPRLTFETNIGGTINVLEIARQTPSLRALVCITSDKCYFNKEWVWGYRENDELGGLDPYSASKAAAEMVYQGYSHSFFSSSICGTATVRAGTVIGGGDWSPDRIVPDCIKALSQHKPIVLRNPKATRPWQHVLEPLSGYLLLAANLYREPQSYSGSWNFGPRTDSVATVEDLAHKMIACWGSGEIQISGTPQDWHEAGLLQVNCDKAHQKLGWYPRWNFEQTVRHTMEWYKQADDGEAVRKITKSQIDQYVETQCEKDIFR